MRKGASGEQHSHHEDARRRKREREQVTENLCERIMMEMLLNLVNKIYIQAQEGQRILNKMTPKKII